MAYHILAWLFFMCGFLMHYIATKKGCGSAGRVFWATMGFYIGPPAIPLIFILCRNKK